MSNCIKDSGLSYSVLLTKWTFSTIGSRTYTPTTFSKDEILQNHASVLNTLNISGNVDDDYELPYLHWIPKLHKTPYKDTLLVPKNVLQNLC
jgi:hypothetical protein